MSRAPIISISGKLCSGKGHLAETLVREAADRNWRTVTLRWSTGLKDDIARMLDAGAPGGILPPLMEVGDRFGPDIQVGLAMRLHEAALIARSVNATPDPWGRPGRWRGEPLVAVLQWWGTDVCRARDPDRWIRRTLITVETLATRSTLVVIPDTRFPNELDAVRGLGGFTVRVEVPEEVRWSRMAAVPGTRPERLPGLFGHRSETALDDHRDFDLTVDGTGDPTRATRMILDTAGIRPAD